MIVISFLVLKRMLPAFPDQGYYVSSLFSLYYDEFVSDAFLASTELVIWFSFFNLLICRITWQIFKY